MTAKPSSGGLGTFGKTPPAPDAAPVKTARRRAQGETVALTVRIGRDDWMRLHHLAMSEGLSIQAIALEGISKVFAAHGLEPVKS